LRNGSGPRNAKIIAALGSGVSGATAVRWRVTFRRKAATTAHWATVNAAHKLKAMAAMISIVKIFVGS
jgi:hypothetical protein